MNSQFKNKLLWKIYLVWFFRRILPLAVLQVAVGVLALKIFAEKVFVAKVFQNAALSGQTDWWEFLGYLGNAYLQTRPAIQIIIPIALGVGALILRDTGRALMVYLRTMKPNSRPTGYIK